MSGSTVFEKRLLTRDRGAGILQKLWQIPWIFVLLLCAVAAVGYVALYSAGSGNPDLYATKHALRFGFCLVMMLCIGFVDIRLIARAAPVAYVVGIGLLVMVALHGEVGKGAQRWVDLGPLQLQPSELMKIVLVLVLAAWFHRASWERVGNPIFLVIPAVLVLVPVGLIFKQPNLGTSLITALLGGA
ncbi:MAG: rod shape-determining protein RodA, partial [Rubritepida sp.]|nr:rod shape-determining protein RodA [Rubritepida sp.]